MERYFNKLKYFERAATHFENHAVTFLAAVALALSRLWIRTYVPTPQTGTHGKGVSSPPADNIPLGAGTIPGTVLALSLGDGRIKVLGGAGGMGLWQLSALRSLLAAPILLVC
ncbi:MAG: hypothetical protein AAFY65_04245 [Pseudomonadota bacterium]